MSSKDFEQIGIGKKFQIGKKGPHIKNEGGVIENRNAADDNYTRVKGADPVEAQDFVTKKYLEDKSAFSVQTQIDGGSPAAGAFSGQVGIVTTAGGGFSLGELYRWDAIGASWVALPIEEGKQITVTDALSGGTVEYLADHLYIWDEDGSVWGDIGPAEALTNVLRAKRETITFNNSDGVVNVSDLIPANAIVEKITANVTQAFNGTSPSLKIGDAALDDRFMTVEGICLDEVGVFSSTVQHLYGADTQVIATLAKDGSTSGSVSLLVSYFIQ